MQLVPPMLPAVAQRGPCVRPSLPSHVQPSEQALPDGGGSGGFLFRGCNLKAPQRCPHRLQEGCCSQRLVRLCWGIKWGRCWSSVVWALLWGSRLGSAAWVFVMVVEPSPDDWQAGRWHLCFERAARWAPGPQPCSGSTRGLCGLRQPLGSPAGARPA